jgi:hypothetical protein
MVAVAALVTDAGAVYVTLVAAEPESVPGPFRAHVTPELVESLETVAVMVVDCPWSSPCGAPLVTATAMGLPPPPHPARKPSAPAASVKATVRILIEIFIFSP